MESTYLLHAATGDARYQHAGRSMQRTLLKRNKAACGFASLADTASGAQNTSGGAVKRVWHAYMAGLFRSCAVLRWHGRDTARLRGKPCMCWCRCAALASCLHWLADGA